MVIFLRILIGVLGVFLFLAISMAFVSVGVNDETTQPVVRNIIFAPGLIPLIFSVSSMVVISGRKAWGYFLGLFVLNVLIHVQVTSINAHVASGIGLSIFWIVTALHFCFVIFCIKAVKSKSISNSEK